MNRPDISNSVIHFTKGGTPKAALDVLLTMVGEGRILGGPGRIQGFQTGYAGGWTTIRC